MESFLGQICLFACDFAPRGFVESHGQLLPISQNQALYHLLGKTYGGDGRNTFGLPDLRGKEPQQGLRYCICVDSRIFPARQ